MKYRKDEAVGKELMRTEPTLKNRVKSRESGFVLEPVAKCPREESTEENRLVNIEEKVKFMVYLLHTWPWKAFKYIILNCILHITLL